MRRLLGERSSGAFVDGSSGAFVDGSSGVFSHGTPMRLLPSARRSP
jgi:hypothetical protein